MIFMFTELLEASLLDGSTAARPLRCWYSGEAVADQLRSLGTIDWRSTEHKRFSIRRSAPTLFGWRQLGP